MKRLGLFISTVGMGILVLGVAMLAMAGQVAAAPPNEQRTPPEGATYVGSDTCFKCHSVEHRDWSNTLHSKMIQDVAVHPEANVGDFSTGEEVRQVEIGGATRAYTAEDVTFTMGNKYRQRYIMKTDTGYMVLPGQWNIDSAKWVEATPGDWLNECAGCHTTGFNVEKLEWSELSVTCEACHGPGSAHVDAASKLTPQSTDEEIYAVRQQIVKSVDAIICGQCHTRGKSPDGAHGYPVGYVVGGPLDETMFVPVAPTGAADDANFWPDGKAKKHREQYIEWIGSSHANALKTIQEQEHAQDRCLACHSTDYIRQDTTFPQDKVTVENAQFGITCVQCHAPHGETGIQDQLTAERYELCVSCHNATGPTGARPIRAGATVHHPMREMFEGISFLGLDPNPSPHFSNEAYGPVCSSCHMVATAKSADYGDIPSHTWKIVKPTEAAEGEPTSCTGCHTLERDPDNTPENLTFAIEEVQADTKERVEALRADLKEITDAHPEWDPQAQEKSDEQKLAEKIHTLVSFVESDGSWGFHNPGFTDDILSEAEDLLEELQDMTG